MKQRKASKFVWHRKSEYHNVSGTTEYSSLKLQIFMLYNYRFKYRPVTIKTLNGDVTKMVELTGVMQKK